MNNLFSFFVSVNCSHEGVDYSDGSCFESMQADARQMYLKYGENVYGSVVLIGPDGGIQYHGTPAVPVEERFLLIDARAEG